MDKSAQFALGCESSQQSIQRLTPGNFVLQGLSYVCFELTALNVLVAYWAPDLHPAICISAGIAGFAVANAIDVRYYGEIGTLIEHY